MFLTRSYLPCFSLSVTPELPKYGDAGASTVPLCGDAAPLGGAGEASEENVVLRTPADLYYKDHRRQIEDSAKIFYCDICWKPFEHQGGVRPYEGNFINKTWNTDEDKKNADFIQVTRVQLLQGWREGVYDLTWHCLKCHAASLGRENDLSRVAQDMGLWKFAAERKKHKDERRRRGFVRD